MSRVEAPFDAWSRRDVMRNGFGSFALVCTFGSQSALKGSTVTTSAARQSQAKSLVGNLQGVFSNDDYPPSALDNNEQGSVGVVLTVGSSGRVTGCSVSKSSGSRTLDSTTCRILSSRARFSPAQDANGNPMTSTYSQTITWRIAE